MVRRVFFCYDPSDLSRAQVVRECWESSGNEAGGFIEPAEREEIRRKGDQGLQEWIDEQLKRASVTLVLVGANTCQNPWIRYEIEKSIELGNGLLGIDVSRIKDEEGNISERCGELPQGYRFYSWDEDNGAENLERWIEAAASQAGQGNA